MPALVTCLIAFVIPGIINKVHMCSFESLMSGMLPVSTDKACHSLQLNARRQLMMKSKIHVMEQANLKIKCGRFELRNNFKTRFISTLGSSKSFVRKQKKHIQYISIISMSGSSNHL